MTNFIPHTPEERKAMLKTVGVASESELFHVIPSKLRDNIHPQLLPATGRTELSLQQHLTHLAGKNQSTGWSSFLGGGAYARFIPPAVNAIASRSEFYTAYTPYQPEISQGTLQMIYEFQTMISELTGMDVTNASVYDGAAAVSEAAFMALRATRRKVLWIANTVNPQYSQVLQTYLDALGGVELKEFDPYTPLEPQWEGDLKQLAAVIVQQPDYFGSVRALAEFQQFCQKTGALFIVSVDPMTLGVLEPPRAFGADIVCGDIQQFGNGVNFGGPYGGFIATTEKLMRQIPGRVVGRTQDKDGQVAYTLTLQTREQHIRRAKATSNICTNQSLNVLKACVYMSLVGPQGLRDVAEVSTERAHVLAEALTAMPGVQLRHDEPFLYEFAIQLPVKAHDFIRAMAQDHHILAGINVGKYWPEEDHTLLIAVTELNSLESIDRYISAFKAVLEKQGITMLSTEDRPASASMLATGTTGGR